jgi:hypothetical protein
MAAERRDAAAGRADQGREAAADINMQAHRRLGARQRHHDHVLQVGELKADRGDAMALRQGVEMGLHRRREAVALERRAGQRQGAHAERVLLAGVDLHQLLGDQHAQDVQHGARHQVERLGDRLPADRRAGAAEQPQDGDGAGDGGNGAHGH